MAYKKYTRAELTADIRDHFGLADKADNNSKIYKSLNEAVARILQTRRSWHFLEQELVLDVEDSKSGVATFTQGSNLVTWTSGDTPAALDILIDKTTTFITDGYRVVDYSAPTITLDANYTGTTGSKSFSATKAYYALPEDFVAASGPIWSMKEIRNKIHYLPTYEFENVRRSLTHTVGRPKYYTVVNDPTAQASPQATDQLHYLMVYPYMMSRTTIRGKYQMHPQEMDDDTAVPILPREFRPVMMNWARYLTALYLKYDPQLVDRYFRIAAKSIDEMSQFEEYVDEDEADGDRPSGMGFDWPIVGDPSIGDNFNDYGP